MLKTGIYVRVQSKEQAGYSIRAQEQCLKEYAKIKKWKVYKVYLDDGISGKNMKDRPAMQEMIEDVRNGKITNVLVFKIDRLAHTADLIELVNLFKDYKCEFNSLCEDMDTQTKKGRMFIDTIKIFTEINREMMLGHGKIHI